ncbi:hypothetical protein B7P43_G01978 [Cryptotermes secundus]|nr:synaptotagmin-15 isoform X1 [Cryptotermes secundus]XP_023715911.1 synaptotagmin-15 isoform X1 [Cryptotermes secundus]XP_023715912.1 synaptotagmin-15 isoform X1 [Cryptotermes secundus]PNF25078.1 hypothetical protein B7P43_G01978 [Cryptotermes secundus]
MWRLGCCPCWKGSAKPEVEDSSLLTDPQWQSDGGAMKAQYYTVRRISSFGRTVSGEDISDTGGEQRNEGMEYRAELRTAKFQKSEPDDTNGDYYGDPGGTAMALRPPHKLPQPHRRWPRALNPFRSPRELSKSREEKEAVDLCVPSITVSSPELLRDGARDQGNPTHPGSPLRHAGTMVNMSPTKVLQQQVRWLNSQSMQDINTALTCSHKKDGSNANMSVKGIDTAEIARTYGLDTSLYIPVDTDSGLMSRSNEALNAWRSSDTRGKADWLQEASCGTIHFTAAYFQKKKLLIHVNKVEHLPPKGEHHTYSVVVKLIILPLDKQLHVSKIYKNNLNPEIEEDFEFIIKHPLGKVLRLSVYDADYQGKHEAVGHALFYLEDVMAGRPRKYAMRLYKQSQPDVDPGNIRVSLSYKRETMILNVLVMEACNLLLPMSAAKNKRPADKYNTYVKVVYISCGEKMKSRKSAIVYNNRNPTYNEIFTFKLSSNFLHESSIIVSVMLKGKLKKDMPIGRLVLGPFQYTEGREKTPWGRALLSQEEVTHWFRMYL